MKWYFSEFSGRKYMREIMNSYGALLVIQARPIEHEKHDNNSYKGYAEFSSKIKRLSLSPPFKSRAYDGCLWNTSGIKIKPEDCSKYNFSVSIIQLQTGALSFGSGLMLG